MNDTAPSLATAAPAPPATGPLARLLAEIGARSGIPFRIVWTDGSVYWNSDTAPAFTLTFRSRRAAGQYSCGVPHPP